MENANAPGAIDVQSVGGGVVVLTLRGEWDMGNAPSIVAAVTDAIEAGCCGIAVDLDAVTFLDSTGLAALLDIQKVAEYSAWDVTFVKPADPHVWRLFEMTALTARFRFLETRAAALIAVANGTLPAPH